MVDTDYTEHLLDTMELVKESLDKLPDRITTSLGPALTKSLTDAFSKTFTKSSIKTSSENMNYTRKKMQENVSSNLDKDLEKIKKQRVANEKEADRKYIQYIKKENKYYEWVNNCNIKEKREYENATRKAKISALKNNAELGALVGSRLSLMLGKKIQYNKTGEENQKNADKTYAAFEKEMGKYRKFQYMEDEKEKKAEKNQRIKEVIEQIKNQKNAERTYKEFTRSQEKYDKWKYSEEQKEKKAEDNERKQELIDKERAERKIQGEEDRGRQKFIRALGDTFKNVGVSVAATAAPFIKDATTMGYIKFAQWYIGGGKTPEDKKNRAVIAATGAEIILPIMQALSNNNVQLILTGLAFRLTEKIGPKLFELSKIKWFRGATKFNSAARGFEVVESEGLVSMLGKLGPTLMAIGAIFSYGNDFIKGFNGTKGSVLKKFSGGYKESMNWLPDMFMLPRANINEKAMKDSAARDQKILDALNNMFKKNDFWASLKDVLKHLHFSWNKGFYFGDKGTVVLPQKNKGVMQQMLHPISTMEEVYTSGKEAEFLKKYKGTINKYSKKYGVDPYLVASVIKNESGFRANAKSSAGAVGLMQLMPNTAKGLGVKNILDPEQNIMGGTKLLSGLIKRYHGNLSLAVAAYNAGAGAVDKYKGIPPYKETQNYTQNVLAHYHKLENEVKQEEVANKKHKEDTEWKAQMLAEQKTHNEYLKEHGEHLKKITQQTPAQIGPGGRMTSSDPTGSERAKSYTTGLNG